jgi:hypothetical protein
MRTTLAAMLAIALATPALAGTSDPRTPPKADLDRPPTAGKPGDDKAVCTYVAPDPNSPPQRTDCIAAREPVPERPVEKTPPGGPGTDAAPSVR